MAGQNQHLLSDMEEELRVGNKLTAKLTDTNMDLRTRIQELEKDNNELGYLLISKQKRMDNLKDKTSDLSTSKLPDRDFRSELEMYLKMYGSPKCGWEFYQDCDEHSSCEDTRRILEGADKLRKERDAWKDIAIDVLEQSCWDEKNEILSTSFLSAYEKGIGFLVEMGICKWVKGKEGCYAKYLPSATITVDTLEEEWGDVLDELGEE